MSNPALGQGCSPEQALANLRQLYARPEHPYYILAPDYRETSSGIASLHYLCHLLNLRGREAYILGKAQVNPDLKTPLLDAQAAQRHVDTGQVPIAIYPEVVEGNPFECSVVARFLLNFEGFITGRGMAAAPSDLLFYSGALIAARHGNPEGDLLCLPTINVDLFCAAAPGTVREGKYLYQNRFALEQIDYSQLPADIRLLSMANALTLAQLADLLRKAQVMYTHEWSMTCVIAVLCGCPVIFIPGHGIDQQFLDASFVGSSGFAMLDQPDALRHASAGVEGALQRYVERTAPFWQQLEVFVDKTQQAARREQQGNALGVLGWLRQRYPLAEPLRLINAKLDAAAAPTIAVVVRASTDQVALARTLDSLQRSLYKRLEVIVLSRDEPDQATARWLPGDSEQWQAPVNTLLADSTSDWFMLVEAGVEFTASGMLMVALKLLETPPSCLALFGDEAVRLDGGAVDLCLRPELNLDLLLAQPANLARHWLYRRLAVLSQQGFGLASGAAAELACQLRLLNEHGLSCVAHVSEPLLVADGAPVRDCPDERAVIAAHLYERGYAQAQVLALAQAAGCYRIDYQHAQQATVSIMIYVQGGLVQLQRCLEILLTQTTHPAYEIVLIEPGSDDPAVAQWLEMVSQIDQARFQVLRFMPGQSRAALCNAAAQEARGDYLVWLDAGVSVLDGGWLQTLLNQAQRPEVGAVAGKLQTGTGLLHRAALVLGLGGSVSSGVDGAAHDHVGYMGRLWLEHDCSALADECLMVRRDSFLQVGGFALDPLLVPWVGADLCLKLQQTGYLNVWTPYARFLIEAEVVSPPGADEEDALFARWLPQLLHDACYNENFSLVAGEAFAVQSNAMSWRPLKDIAPTVLVLASACEGDAQLRLIQPHQALGRAGLIDGTVHMGLMSPVQIERFAPASIVMQRPIDEDQLLTLRRLRAFSQAFKICDLDGFAPGLAAGGGAAALLEHLQPGLMQADRVVVSSPVLADLLRGAHDDIRLLESALSADWGRLQGQRRTAERARVGWLGSTDAALLEVVVPALANEVDWVVIGECPSVLQPFVKELHPAVEPGQLGLALAALNLDLALVPLADTLVNACGSDLRVLQHAACGHPVVCSRVAGLAGADSLPLSRVANQTEEWLRAIRLHLEDRDASAALGDALQAAVRADWLLAGPRLQAWRQVWLER